MRREESRVSSWCLSRVGRVAVREGVAGDIGESAVVCLAVFMSGCFKRLVGVLIESLVAAVWLFRFPSDIARLSALSKKTEEF